MRKIIYFIVASLISLMMQAQTVLVNPNAEGGFELGTDFAANGWTVDNGAQTNQWFVGTVPLSPNNNAAYISNDGGTTWNYTNTSTSVVHFYRDITFPAGETDIQLSFWIKGIGESSFDRLRVYLVPTTTTPVAGTELSSGQVGQANYSLQNEWIKVGIQIPASAAGTTQRLVFSWRNDNSSGTNPPIAIDNISLISQVPYNLSGTYTIDNSLPTGGLNFNGFVDAILTLNSATITGPVDFIVTSGQQFTEILPVITATGTAANTITFAKSGVAYPKILSSGFNTTTDAIIALRGGDYFTFNGLELGLLVPIHNQLEYGIYVFNENATNGAQNNIFNDIIISLNRAYTSSRAVYQNVATTPSDVTGANSYNTYNAINVSNSYNGIVITGNATYPDLGLTVQNCIIGSDNPNDIGFGTSAISGLRITSGRDVVVANNIVRNLTITGGANLFGLFMENIQGTSEIYNNKVYNLTSTSTSTSAVLTGLRADVTSTNTANVYNNVVYGFNHAIASPSATNVARGMVANLSGAGTVNLAYNSVNIALNANASNDALRIGGGTVNLVNNVLVNSSASGSTSNRYCIYRSGGTIISDYNNIYIPSGTNNYIGYYTSNQTTMTDWQAAVSGDANSISVDPLFTGTPDLMPSNPAMNNLGTTVPGITTDILGVARNATNPDMGAYEFNPPTCVMPTDLTVSGITTNSAILGWTSSASEWNIEVGLPGFTPGNSEYVVSIYGSVANPTPATGLTHSTQYQFYVQSVCGIETSSWAGPVSFSTLCGTITSFPYTESFDGTTFAPTCWTNQKTAGSGTGLWDRQTSGSNPTCTPHSGAGMARFNCFNYSSGTAGILVTPEISAPANHIVEFWMYRDNGYSSDLDRVNVYTNATPDLTGATLLGTINRSITQTPVEASNGWYKYKYDLPAGNQYIIFEGISAYGNNIFIDDITIKEKPTSTVTWCNLQWPGNFTMTTNENVEIYAQVYEAGITDAIGQGAGIEAWIGYSTANTNPSTWTNWIPAIYNVDVGNNDEYKITLGSLAPGTYYYASRFSLNEGPYSYGGFNGGFWDGTNNVSGVLTVNAILGSHCDNPYIVQIPADLTYAQSHTTCGMSNYYDLSSTSYDNGEDAIYRLDVTQNTVVKITMTPVETYSGLFLFDACPNSGTLLQSVTNSTNTPRIITQALTAGTYYIMVDIWPTPNCTDYSIQIEVVCPAPTNITATNITSSQADLSWTPSGFETSWNVKVSSTSIDPTAETGDIYDGIVNSLPLQLTGLTESTTYYVYVQAACVSTWTNGIFTTTASCPLPTDLTTTNILHNQADLDWNAYSGTNWNLKVSTTAIDPETESGNIFDGAINTKPYTITGLNAQTTYYWYVQTICGTETSNWSAQASFTTSCAPISSFPFIESFDGTTFAPTCWTNEKTAGTGTGLWDRQTNGSNPTCTPHSGAGMARFNCYSYSSGTAGILVTPEISAPANHIVEFWMYRDNGYSSSLDRVNVYTNATPDLTGATLLGTINRSITQTPVVASNGWYKYKYDLPAGNQYIIFEGISAYGNNIFIDDVTVRQLSSEKDILSFVLAEQTGPAIIDNINHTVDIEVGIGTDVTNLTPTITVSPNAVINPASGIPQDFTNPVTYTVTAEDLSTQDWIVTVTVATALSSSKDILSFSFPEQTGPATIGTNTVDIEVNWMANLAALTPTITVSPFASISPASGVTLDFTNPVVYTVTAQDLSTKDYTVTVTKALPTLGSHCDNPYIVQIPADLTYAQSHTTCGMSNYYDLSSTSYDNGEDAIYRLDVTQNTVVKITMTPVETWSGLFLFDACPDTGTLIQSVTNSEATPRIIIEALTVGTYYVMVDTWPSPNCTDYSIQIEVVCPAPTGITATNITTSQADLSWTAGGFETSWNVKVSSTAIDPTAETGDIYDGIVNSLPLQLTGLTESTTYYVYVQAACASTWTNGTFTTADACPVPTNLTATTGINDANLSWSSFTGDSWNLKVSSTPIDPSTETADIVDINLSSTSYNVSGLNSNTTYYWYVQTVCTVPAESNWSGQATFTTQCGIFNLPFAEDFESGMLNCWTILNVDGGLPVWTLNTSQNHTPGGNTSIYHNYNGANSDDGWLITPAIQLPTNQNINLSFWSYNSFPTWYGENSVWVSTTGTDPSDFTKIWQPSSVTASWEQTNLDLSSYAGEIVYVAFRYAGYDAHAWYLDDINITATPIIVNQINQIDINNDVVDVQVCLGTSEVEAISLLANQITITDTEDNQYIVDLTWTVASYDANTAGDYTATGTFELPAGVNQTDPPTALEVTATITVNELPVVTCPEDFILTTNSIVTLTGENPTGGVYSGTGVSGYIFNPDGLDNGDYTITYTYTDPVTGCVNSCNFTITLDIDVNVSAQTISAISIYPNPNNGKFSVVFNNFEGKVTYGIYDAKGSVIITEEVYTSGNTVRDFDIKLVPGVYYIKMTNDSNTFVEKIVIQ
jgi:hypothetical protein